MLPGNTVTLDWTILLTTTDLNTVTKSHQKSPNLTSTSDSASKLFLELKIVSDAEKVFGFWATSCLLEFSAWKNYLTPYFSIGKTHESTEINQTAIIPAKSIIYAESDGEVRFDDVWYFMMKTVNSLHWEILNYAVIPYDSTYKP